MKNDFCAEKLLYSTFNEDTEVYWKFMHAIWELERMLRPFVSELGEMITYMTRQDETTGEYVDRDKKCAAMDEGERYRLCRSILALKIMEHNGKTIVLHVYPPSHWRPEFPQGWTDFLVFVGCPDGFKNHVHLENCNSAWKLIPIDLLLEAILALLLQGRDRLQELAHQANQNVEKVNTTISMFSAGIRGNPGVVGEAIKILKQSS